MLDENYDLRRQIIEDILGDSVDEYENFNKEEISKDSPRQHRQRIPLWRFLLHLLNRDTNKKYIEWSDQKHLEFRIKDTSGVAGLWGSVKDKHDMTYEKLGRAMRYYYGKNVIEKVSGKRYSYQFVLSRRTMKHLTQFIDTDQIEELQHPVKSKSENKMADLEKPKTKDSPTNCNLPIQYNKIENLTKPEKIVPVKPLPQQVTGKTKIFRPNNHMVNTFSSSEPSVIAKSLITLNNSADRPSAFVQPVKRKLSKEDTELFMKMPKLERVVNCVPSVYPVKAFCCDRKISHGDLIESKSTDLSHRVRKLTEFGNYSTASRKSQEFIFRRQTHLGSNKEMKMNEAYGKLKTSRRTDPFMGVEDYFRNEEEEHKDIFILCDDLDEVRYTHQKRSFCV